MSRITNDPKVTHEWQIVGDVIVTRTGGSIPEELWSGFIDELIAKDVRKIFSLVVGPSTINSTQRKGAADTFKERGVVATVVTDDRMTRGILTALSWLGASIKGFSWMQLDAAIANVTSVAKQQVQIKEIAERCKAEIQ